MQRVEESAGKKEILIVPGTVCVSSGPRRNTKIPVPSDTMISAGKVGCTAVIQNTRDTTGYRSAGSLTNTYDNEPYKKMLPKLQTKFLEHNIFLNCSLYNVLCQGLVNYLP